jgi:hypothetical protein
LGRFPLFQKQLLAHAYRGSPRVEVDTLCVWAKGPRVQVPATVQWAMCGHSGRDRLSRSCTIVPPPMGAMLPAVLPIGGAFRRQVAIGRGTRQLEVERSLPLLQEQCRYRIQRTFLEVHDSVWGCNLCKVDATTLHVVEQSTGQVGDVSSSTFNSLHLFYLNV